MCLALIAFAAHPRYRLVIAANRDEFHARPAAPAAWWTEGFLAGRDLKEGGTWLGIDRRGRVALLTNVRDPSQHDPRAPSRGALVPRLLASNAAPSESLPALVRDAARYNGYNLLAGDAGTLMWGSNRAAAPVELGPGIYGVSNHLLDTPWPKVEHTKRAFRQWCAAGADDLAPLFALLHDTERAPDAMLPATGVTLERERMLSSPFIVSPDYGTRCSTVVTVEHDGAAHFIERSFDPDGSATGEIDVRFSVDQPAGAQRRGP
ncbi:MAG: NRDE family protein [Casimicrobiaceae bacterium]